MGSTTDSGDPRFSRNMAFPVRVWLVLLAATCAGCMATTRPTGIAGEPRIGSGQIGSIIHRAGMNADYPENSLAAIQQCVALG